MSSPNSSSSTTAQTGRHPSQTVRGLIARRVMFSSAHFYNQPAWSEEKNLATFGACFTPHGHGHNYVFEAFVEGVIDQQTGLIIDLAKLDQWMKEASCDLDHHHLNLDIDEFKTQSGKVALIPTSENIARLLQARLESKIRTHAPQLKLNRVRLFETDDIWAELRSSDQASSERIVNRQLSWASVTRQFEIRSMHHLECATLSPDENRKLYGICYGTHGHHYKIQVTLRGPLNQHGQVVAIDEFERLVKTAIVEPYDGVDLNAVFANTSCEQIAYEFYQILDRALKAHNSDVQLEKIGVQETRKNFFEYPPEK